MLPEHEDRSAGDNGGERRWRISLARPSTTRGIQLFIVAEAADRCTSCGKCFEVCPTAREAGLDAAEAVQRIGELKALTLGGAPADGLQKWLGACDASARCSAACPV